MSDKDGHTGLEMALESNITNFAQFLARQNNADSLKQEFDKAYHLARYEAKLKAKCQGRWMRVSECPRMSK